jgi:branched-chain amino acid transport system substrate-binding protein
MSLLKRCPRPVALVLAAGVVAAGCSSSSKSSTPTTASSSATSAAAATTSAPSAGPPTGTPIKLFLLAPLSGGYQFPQAADGANAAAKAINAAGGVKGHPIQIDVCDGKTATDPNPSVQCVRAAAADTQVIADVGSYSSFGDLTQPIFKAAGMASIGNPAFSVADQTFSNSFPFLGEEGPASVAVLFDQGAKKIVFAHIDLPNFAHATSDANAILQTGRGAALAGDVATPITATDVTPYVAQSARKGDAVALSIPPNQTIQWVHDNLQGAYNQKVVFAALNLQPATLSAMGSAAEGVYVASSLPLVSTSSPGMDRFKSEMTAYKPSAVQDEIALNSWISAWAFAQVGNTLSGDITRQSILDAFGNLTNFNVFGLLPPNFSTTRPGTLPIPNATRIFNTYVVEGKIEGGNAVDVGNGYVSLLKK